MSIHALPLLKALADETRIRLCHVLLKHELNVRELVEVFGMGQSRISRHLKILSDCSLLTYRRDGLWVFYVAAEQGRGRQLLEVVEKMVQVEPLMLADLERAEQVLAERSRATRRFFDSVAGEWAALRSDVLGDFDLHQALHERLAPCGVVLDMGCGAGELLGCMADMAGQGLDWLIGVDSSPKMIEQARKRLAQKAEHVSLRIGELEHLPVRDGEADCGVISMVLHHLPDPKQAINEASRAIAPGGRLLLAEFDKHDDESMRHRHSDRWLGFSPEQLQDWLQEAGFRPAQCLRQEVNRGLAVLLLEAHKPQHETARSQTHERRETA